MASTVPRVELVASVIARRLGWTAVVLVAASLGGQASKFFFDHDHLFGLVMLFNVDEEQNVPTFFSMLLLLVAAALLGLIARLTARGSRRDAVPWAGLTVGFTAMAYDEICQVHEQLHAPMAELLGGRHAGPLDLALWIIPALVLVLVLALVFRRFLLRLPAASRFEFLLAATIYLGGAMGFELLGAAYAENHAADFIDALLTNIEEGLEMAGVIYFIRALLLYLARHHADVAVHFSERS